MPRPEVSDLRQKAVLLAATGKADTHGEFLVGAAQEISVRWSFDRRETRDPEGQSIAIDAVAAVAVAIPIGSRLWLGKLANFTGEANHTMMTVVNYREVPDLKARNFRRSVDLKKYKG